MDEMHKTNSDELQITSGSSWLDWNETPIPKLPELPPEMKDFSLYDALGNGSTGMVYKTIQKKEYAVKAIPWKPNNLRDYAKREFEIGKMFSECKTTVHVISYYEHNSYSFILQEIGEPIIEYFIHKRCTLRMLLQSIIEVSSALKFIHSKGYSHFDVKPDNILIIDGRARLADFSHCLKFAQGQEYVRSFGTNIFMAPEIKLCAKYSGLEDMYSLGMTMYALLLPGALPPVHKTDEADKTANRIHSLFIHPCLMSIIQKATSDTPSERYHTFDAFSNEILAFMRDNDEYIDECVPTYNLQESCSLRSQSVIWGGH